MTEIKLTWMKAIKIWWSFFWRGVFVAILCGFIVNFGSIAGYDIKITVLLTFIVSILLQIHIVKYVLGKKFTGFRIALLSAE